MLCDIEKRDKLKILSNPEIYQDFLAFSIQIVKYREKWMWACILQCYDGIFCWDACIAIGGWQKWLVR